MDELPLPRTANSIYPPMVDLGLVAILFGLFLVGNAFAVLGAVVLIVGLTGWYREARAEFERLPE